MTASLAADKLLLGTSLWGSDSNAPSLAAAIGSMWQRQGSPPTTPTEIYLKLVGAGAAGWVKQNVVNLNVYNVVNFGALGTGGDDTVAINAAVSAAIAAGGGIIYFPPAASFYGVTKPVTGIGSISLLNAHDLVFLGDGYASHISMIGSAGGGEWYMFRLRDGTSRIKFINLFMDGPNITNPDPSSQNHIIDNSGVTGDVSGGTTDVDIIGCYFGVVGGSVGAEHRRSRADG